MQTESSIYAILKCRICENPVHVFEIYRQTFNIKHTLCNKITSDVVGASHVGAALITPSFSTWY